jgi:iron complex outermembrane receptor protein
MKTNLLILFLGFTLHISAQKLSGIITNEQRQPIIGAQIYIDPVQSGTTTDENGYYELTNLPNASIKIFVSHLGYESQTRQISLSKQEMSINFQLRESVFEMDEIIISTPFYKLQSENVIKVERISLQNLDNKGMVTLMKGLSNLPGVSQVSTGLGIGKPVIRGLRGNRVLVYNQGIRLENQQFGDEHGLGINDFGIESVEVIKGPASLLYGSDALGGVLYFNPLKYADINSFSAAFNQKYFSNTQGITSAIGFKKSFEQWKFLVNATSNQHADYRNPNKERLTNSRFKETTVNSGLAFKNGLLSTSMRFSHNASKIGIPESVNDQSTSRTPLVPYQDLRTDLLSLNSIFFFSNSKLNTTFGFTGHQREEFEEDNGTPSLGLKLNTWSYDLKWHLPKRSEIETILGIQGLTQKNTNFGEEILIPNANIDDFGALITSSYSWKNNHLMAGIRYDIRKINSERHLVLHDDETHIFEPVDKSFKNVSMSLGIKSILFENIVSRLNLASGFKAPNLAELTSNGVHHGTNRFEIGNNDLERERNFQWDLSLEYGSDHLEIFVNGFFNHINDYIFISPTGEKEEENFIFQYMQEDADLYGGEFGFHFHPHPLDRIHFKSSFECVVGKQKNGDYLPLIPANKLSNEFRIEFGKNKKISHKFASINFESNFSQKNVSEFETITAGYNLVNINTGGRIKLKTSDVMINLSLNNVFNKSYISHLSRLKNDGILNMGRNFMASLIFNI